MSVNKKKIVSRKRSPAKQDRRIRRTRDRLALAIRQLIQEKTLQSITVQELLDRAGVSRSAFYAHFSDTQDLFLSDMDQFLEFTATSLSRCREQSERLVAVREFFAHVGENAQMRQALARSDYLSDFFELAREHFARGIERRLSEIPRSSGLSKLQRAALAHALAGALMSQLDWWTRQRKCPSAEEMDRGFHQLAWAGIPSVESSRRRAVGEKRASGVKPTPSPFV